MTNISNEKGEVQLLKENAVAKVLSVSASVLRKRRRLGLPPKWVKLGRSVRYSSSDISQFIESQTQQAA